MLPVSLLAGPVVAYNSFVFLSFALTSYGTFLWARTMTRNNLLALGAGVVSVFFPYRLIYVYGQLPQLATQWIPFAFWALERYCQSQRARWATTAGLFLALNALSSWYNFVFMALATPLYLFLRMPQINRIIRQPVFWRDMLIIGALLAGFTVPVMIPYLQLSRERNTSHERWQHRYFAVNPAQLLAQSVEHPLWGEWVREWAISQEERPPRRPPALVGWSMLALAGLGFATARLRRRVRALAAIALVGALGSFGPILTDYRGNAVTFPAPDFMQPLYESGMLPRLTTEVFDSKLGNQIAKRRSVFIPLPFALLYRLPPFSFIRYSSRYIILTNFALCGLAVMGVDALTRRLRQRWTRRVSDQSTTSRWLSIVTLGGLIALLWGLTLFEFWRKPHVTTVLRPRPADVWLAEQPAGALVELPLARATQRFSVYAQLNHGHPLILGIGGTFPPPIHFERTAVLESLPDVAAAQTICSWGARYIFVDPQFEKAEEVDKWLAKLRDLPIAHERIMLDRVHVIVLTGCSDEP